MRRLWLLLAIPVVLVLLAYPRSAAPRPAAQLSPATTPSAGVTSGSTEQRTGAPQGVTPVSSGAATPLGTPASTSDGSDRTLAGGAPHPSSKPGDWSCSDPPNCGEPTAKPKPLTVKASDGIAGTATWWYSFGPGIYAALRPDLGSKGDLAIVCGGKPFHCLTVPVTTTCACLGPNSDRLIDLSLDAFRSFADPSRGVVKIVLQVVRAAR